MRYTVTDFTSNYESRLQTSGSCTMEIKGLSLTGFDAFKLLNAPFKKRERYG